GTNLGQGLVRVGAGVGAGVGASVPGACFPGHVGVLGSGGAHVGERGVHLAVEPELLRHLGVLQGGGAGVAEGAVAGLHGQFGVLGGPEPGAVLGAEHRVDLVQQPVAAAELFGGGVPARVCGGVGVLAVAGGGVPPVLVGACLGCALVGVVVVGPVLPVGGRGVALVGVGPLVLCGSSVRGVLFLWFGGGVPGGVRGFFGVGAPPVGGFDRVGVGGVAVVVAVGAGGVRRGGVVVGCRPGGFGGSGVFCAFRGLSGACARSTPAAAAAPAAAVVS